MKINAIKAISKNERPVIKNKSDGSLVFEFPERIKQLLDKNLEFDYSNLNIEAEPTVMDLVYHLSKQADIECFLSTQVAYVKNQIEVYKEVYNSWYNSIAYQHRIELMDKYKSRFTEKLLENFMYSTYREKILLYRAKIIQLETKYRDLTGIKEAFVNKGKYLQTIKGLTNINSSFKQEE